MDSDPFTMSRRWERYQPERWWVVESSEGIVGGVGMGSIDT